jgi:Methyltransferase domain
MMINTRADLAKHFSDLGFNIGAEIGVLGGTYSEVLCLANPSLKLFCIDSWGMGERRLHDYHVRKWEMAKIKLAPFTTVLMREFSLDALQKFEDGSLDFVYIDANHNFEAVSKDITGWAKKVRVGGIVSGHDYHPTYLKGSMGVTEAVDTYVKATSVDLQLTTKEKENISWWFEIK